MHQEPLWHDRLEDAIRTAISAIGGPKKAANLLWPAKSITDGQRKLLHCLDPERPEKLALEELDLIGQKSAEFGCHTIISYLAQSWGYADPQPVSPEDEQAKLQREFMASVKLQEQLVRRLERASNKVGGLD